MGVFSFLVNKKNIFTTDEQTLIVEAIRAQERRTSGEIRIYIESKCKYVDPVDRAKEIFLQLEMTKTADRNGVLLYIAHKDKQLAILGDEGIHLKLGDGFWLSEVQKILQSFNATQFVEGIITIVNDIGNALYTHFPFDEASDKNELPDDIVFGR